eukprot:8449650-Alexandrium_andersonii.AAC.1
MRDVEQQPRLERDLPAIPFKNPARYKTLLAPSIPGHGRAMHNRRANAPGLGAWHVQSGGLP